MRQDYVNIAIMSTTTERVGLWFCFSASCNCDTYTASKEILYFVHFTHYTLKKTSVILG